MVGSKGGHLKVASCGSPKGTWRFQLGWLVIVWVLLSKYIHNNWIRAKKILYIGDNYKWLQDSDG